MEDTLIKPDIVLVTKNIMVPLALPAPDNKFFLAPRVSRKKTPIVKAGKSRLLPGRTLRSSENAMLQTNVELLRSSDYLACDYDSLIDWEEGLQKNYELLYHKELAPPEAGFGDSLTEGDGSLDYLSQNFPECRQTFSLINDTKDTNSDKAEGKEMLFEGSLKIAKKTLIFTEDQSFNLCGKGHTLEQTEINKKQNCLPQTFSEHCKTFSLKNEEKNNMSDEAEGKTLLFGDFKHGGNDLGNEKNDLGGEKNNFGISTSGRDYNESFNRCGTGNTLDVTISGEAEVKGNKKQHCLSQSFPARPMAAARGRKISKTSLLSHRKDNGKKETDCKEITSDESTENELKVFDANIQWKLRESSSTELRRCASSATSLQRSKSITECGMKYSWQDLANWVPPSAKKMVAEIDETSDLTKAKKLDCKITYSWQIIGTGAQTSYELIRSLLTSAEEGVGKRTEVAASYPCAVKYSWQIIGTGTQVSFRRDNDDSLPIDGDYWNGKILKPRKRFVEGSREGSGSKTGSGKILYSQMTQTVIDEAHQTELGDCRVKYSWQNLTKPYLEKTRRP